MRENQWPFHFGALGYVETYPYMLAFEISAIFFSSFNHFQIENTLAHLDQRNVKVPF